MEQRDWGLLAKLRFLARGGKSNEVRILAPNTFRGRGEHGA